MTLYLHSTYPGGFSEFCGVP